MGVWYQNLTRKRQQHLPQRSQRTQRKRRNLDGEETAKKRKEREIEEENGEDAKKKQSRDLCRVFAVFLALPSSSRFLRRLNSYLCDLCVLCGERCFFAVFSHFSRFAAHFFLLALVFRVCGC
jgi:hypothetical protein